MNSTDNKVEITYSPNTGQPIKSPFAVLPNVWQQCYNTPIADTGAAKIQKLEDRIRVLEDTLLWQDSEFRRKINALYELLVNED